MTAAGPADSAIVGRYRLIQRLGEGGMGVVHLGVDPQGNTAAVKILRAHIAADPDARRRMEREVRTLRRLRHSRIAEVLDAELTGEIPYLVTRFVPGKTLDQRVRDDGPLSLDEALGLGRGLAEALTAIHSAGIVHRDLKPANVMLVDTEPVVIDFGIAHLVDESRITMTGLVMGTPGYLSPEVVEGLTVTDATDWWGWAATMAFAVTGRPPFGAGPTEVVLDRVRRGKADLAGVPGPLSALLSSVLTAAVSERRTGTQIRQWLGMDPADEPIDVSEAVTVRYPAPTGHNGLERTVRYPAPAERNGLDRTVRHSPPNVPAETVFDVSPTEPTLAFPAPVPAPAPMPMPADPIPGPTTRPTRRSDVERPIIVPPRPHPAPPNLPPGPVPGPMSGPVPGPPTPGVPTGPAPQGPADGPVAPIRPTGTLLLAALALAGVAAVAPGGAVMILLLVMVLARTTDRSATLIWRRRSVAGPRAGDIPVVVVSLPWQITLAAISSVFALILPMLITVSVAFIVGTTSSPDVSSGPSSPFPLAVAALAGVMTAWWGPGGGAFRRGSRSMARWSISGTAGRIVTWSLLVLVTVSAVLVTAQGEPVDWAPFPSPGTVLLTDR